MPNPTLLSMVCGLMLLGVSVANGQGTGQAAGGGATATNGLEVGTAIEDRLVDSDSVFGVERGDGVGASASTVSGFSTLSDTGAAANGGGGGFGGMGGLGGLGGLFGGAFNQMNQSQQGQTRAVRARLRSAVQVAPSNPLQVQANLQRRIQTSPSATRFRGTNVAVEGRTATLSGQVGSAADQRMAMLLMRLEPGVSRVNNQLNVVAPQTDASPSDLNPVLSP